MIFTTKKGGSILQYDDNSNDSSDRKNFLIWNIITQYYNDIYRFCYLNLKNNNYDADDCTQDIFHFMMKNADKLVIGGDIKAWLYKVAIYKIKEYRKQKSKFDYLEDIGELPYKDKYWDGESNSVFRYLMLSDFLTNIEKNIVHDYFFVRLTPEQIAEKYNITENAFFIRMTRIKKKISDYIKDNEVSL